MRVWRAAAAGTAVISVAFPARSPVLGGAGVAGRAVGVGTAAPPSLAISAASRLPAPPDIIPHDILAFYFFTF